MKNCMKTAVAILGLSLATSNPTSAGEAENILACIEAVEAYSDRTVDEFDVRYTGRFLGFSTAQWPGIDCEVSLASVFNLTIDGRQHVFEGFAGRQASSAYDELEADTEDAISLLESRIQLLERRLEEARDALRMPNPDTEQVRSFVHEGINRATGD